MNLISVFAIPEPSAVGLLGFAAVVVTVRHRIKQKFAING
jgi:hypothetical protein